MSEKLNLDLHGKLSLLTGIFFPMPKDYEKKSSCFRFWWKFYVYFTHVLMFVEFLSQTMQIVMSINNVEVLTTCILSTVYLTQYLLRIIILCKYSTNFGKVFCTMTLISESLTKNPMRDEKFPFLHNQYFTMVTRIGIYKGCFQLIANVFLCSFICVATFLGMKREITPANGWTPYDSSKCPGFTITCVIEMVCYGMVTARCIALDILFWVMLIVPATQLNYLKYLLEIMFKEEEEATCVVHSDNKKRETSEEIKTQELKWWINHHQMILKNMMQFQELSSNLLVVNYASSLINLFMLGIIVTSESSKWDALQKSMINGIIIMDVLQLYCISLAGDILQDSSRNVANLGFTTVLLQMKKPVRQMYLFILTRARKGVQLRFGGVNPLSTHTFSKLLQGTISYSITMAQVKNSKLNPFT